MKNNQSSLQKFLLTSSIAIFLLGISATSVKAQYGNLLSKAAADALPTNPKLCFDEMAELIKKDPANPAPRVEEARCIFLFATGKPGTEGLLKELMAEGKTEALAKIEAKNLIENKLTVAIIKLQMIYTPYSPAQNLLGSINKALGKPKRAKAAFDLAIYLDQKNYRAYANRGKLRDDLGDVSGAVADYEKVVALGINDPFISKRLPELKQKLSTIPATVPTNYKVGQNVEVMLDGFWYKGEITNIEDGGNHRIWLHRGTREDHVSKTTKFLRPWDDSSGAGYFRKFSPLWEERFGIPEANLEAILLASYEITYGDCESSYFTSLVPPNPQTSSDRAKAYVGPPGWNKDMISLNAIVGNANLKKINTTKIGGSDRKNYYYLVDDNNNWWNGLDITTPRGNKPNLRFTTIEITDNQRRDTTFEPVNDDYVGVFRFVCTAKKSVTGTMIQPPTIAKTPTNSNPNHNSNVKLSDLINTDSPKLTEEQYKAIQEKMKNDPEARKLAEEALKQQKITMAFMSLETEKRVLQEMLDKWGVEIQKPQTDQQKYELTRKTRDVVQKFIDRVSELKKSDIPFTQKDLDELDKMIPLRQKLVNQLTEFMKKFQDKESPENLKNNHSRPSAKYQVGQTVEVENAILKDNWARAKIIEVVGDEYKVTYEKADITHIVPASRLRPLDAANKSNNSAANIQPKKVPSQAQKTPCWGFKSLTLVSLGEKKGLADSADNLLIPLEFEWVSSDVCVDSPYETNREIVAVRKDGFWGYFNTKTQKMVGGFEFKEAGAFSKGIASVKQKNDEWNFIGLMTTEEVNKRVAEAKEAAEELGRQYTSIQNDINSQHKYNWSARIERGRTNRAELLKVLREAYEFISVRWQKKNDLRKEYLIKYGYAFDRYEAINGDPLDKWLGDSRNNVLEIGKKAGLTIYDIKPN